MYTKAISTSFPDEVKLCDLEEANPIEDYLDAAVTETEIETKPVAERQAKLETNRRLKLKNSVEQKPKQLECSDCGDVFTSCKM